MLALTCEAHSGLVLMAHPETRRLWHRAAGCGLVREREVPLRAGLHEDFGRHLVWAEKSLEIPEIKPPDYWQAQWLAEEARRAALDGNWKAVGERLDKLWASERPDNRFDQLYAALRIAGAHGGRFLGRGVVLLVPPAKHPAVRDVFAKHEGWVVQ